MEVSTKEQEGEEYVAKDLEQRLEAMRLQIGLDSLELSVKPDAVNYSATFEGETNYFAKSLDAIVEWRKSDALLEIVRKRSEELASESKRLSERLLN